MNGAIPVGRYAGIPIRAHWSVLLIVVLLTVLLAQDILPAAAPGVAVAAYWVTALAGAVTLLACLLGHELAHAAVARRSGVRIRSITMWALGGMTAFTDEPATPKASALIAVGGPAESIVVGGLFWLATAVTSPDWWGGLPVTSLAWLTVANLVIGVFNLLPAAPLDGGRLLHAWLWLRSGDRVQATARATAVGQLFGYLLAGLGVAQLFAGDALGGVWLALVGWFIASAALSEGQQAQVLAGLEGVRVRDVMTPDPVVAPGWWTIDAFADHVATAGIRHRVFPVRSFDGEPTGLVNLADLASAHSEAQHQTRLHDAAHPLAPNTTARADEPLTDVLRRANPRTNSVFAVVENHTLVGILTTTDIMRTLELARLGHRPPHSAVKPPGAGPGLAAWGYGVGPLVLALPKRR